MILCRMLDFCKPIFEIVVDLFRLRTAVDAEFLVLRWQKTLYAR